MNSTVYEQGYQLVGPNDVSAMPSLHVALPFAMALVLWRVSRGKGLLAFVYSALMALSLVYLGEHYVIDTIAGSGMAFGLFVASQRAGILQRVLRTPLMPVADAYGPLEDAKAYPGMPAHTSARLGSSPSISAEQEVPREASEG